MVEAETNEKGIRNWVFLKGWKNYIFFSFFLAQLWKKKCDDTLTNKKLGRDWGDYSEKTWSFTDDSDANHIFIEDKEEDDYSDNESFYEVLGRIFL